MGGAVVNCLEIYKDNLGDKWTEVEQAQTGRRLASCGLSQDDGALRINPRNSLPVNRKGEHPDYYSTVRKAGPMRSEKP